MRYISVVTLLALVACGSDSIMAPSPDIAGGYHVLSYTVAELPVLTLRATGTLRLNSDSTFTLTTNGLGGWDSVRSGRWSMSGESITLSPQNLSGAVRRPNALQFDAQPCQNPAAGQCYPFLVFAKD